MVPVSLEPVMQHVPAWLMVLFRLTGIFIFAPVFGSNMVPRQVKVFLVVTISLCVYPMLLDAGRPSSIMLGHLIDHGLSFYLMVGYIAVELLIGLAIGYAVSLPIIGMQLGGHVIDQQMGISLGGVINPEFDEEAGILGQLMFVMAMMIFVILGGHRIMLATLMGSFDHIPLGGFNGFGALVDFAVGVGQIMFDLAVRIAAPLLCLMFVLMVGMGFIARTVPQFNILSVGFSIRILVGLAIMVAFATIAGGVFVDLCRQVLTTTMRFFTQ